MYSKVERDNNSNSKSFYETTRNSSASSNNLASSSSSHQINRSVNNEKTQPVTTFKPAILSNETFVVEENVLIQFIVANNAKYI